MYKTLFFYGINMEANYQPQVSLPPGFQGPINSNGFQPDQRLNGPSFSTNQPTEFPRVTVPGKPVATLISINLKPLKPAIQLPKKMVY